jgi:hypothetical protein
MRVLLCVTLMRKSELSQSVLAVLNSHPTKCFTLEGIAENLGKTIDRESPFRASLSRCLNRLHREGMVTYEYLELYPELFARIGKSFPNKHAGKYWSINSEH